MRKGFAIVAALVAAGLLLQLFAGGVEWQWLAWPANIVVLALLAAITLCMHALRRRVRLFAFLATARAAVPALTAAVAQTLVMGLTRQGRDGGWLSDMLTFWPFVLAYLHLAVILALVVCRQVERLARHRELRPSLLLHLGLLVALATATLGSADMRRLRLMAVEGQPEWHAYDSEGTAVELPFAVELRRFIMELYDNGTPRRYASEVIVYSTASNHKYAATIDVNRPVEVDGWKIYQQGYDQRRGPASAYSVLELVSDPWLPWAYGGICTMIAGAAMMLFTGRRRFYLDRMSSE